MPKCRSLHPEDRTRACILRAGVHADHMDDAGTWPDPEVAERIAFNKAHGPSRKKKGRSPLTGLAASASRGRLETLAKERAVARGMDPETAHAAAASVEDLTEKQLEVYGLLLGNGPLTHQQMIEKAEEQGVRQSTSGIRTRCEELVRIGLVEDSGERGMTKSNRETIVWQIAQNTVSDDRLAASSQSALSVAASPRKDTSILGGTPSVPPGVGVPGAWGPR